MVSGGGSYQGVQYLKILKYSLSTLGILVLILDFIVIINRRTMTMAFTKGRSGNPKGRPKGVKDRRTIYRDLIEPVSDQLIGKAIDMAMDGNEPMLRLILERVLPAKPRDEPIDININSGTQVAKAKQILKLLSNGGIAPTVAKCLMDTLATEVRIIEFENLEKRVKEIEETIKYGIRENEFVSE